MQEKNDFTNGKQRTEDNSLLPCPKCGSNDSTQNRRATDECWISCDACPESTKVYKTLAEARIAWDTRPSSDLDRLREFVADVSTPAVVPQSAEQETDEFHIGVDCGEANLRSVILAEIDRLRGT
mgnify:FL=1